MGIRSDINPLEILVLGMCKELVALLNKTPEVDEFFEIREKIKKVGRDLIENYFGSIKPGWAQNHLEIFKEKIPKEAKISQLKDPIREAFFERDLTKADELCEELKKLEES